MNRRWFSVGVMGLLLCGQAPAESLPQWSGEDRARLLRGDLLVGASILVENSRDIAMPREIAGAEIAPIEPTGPEPAYDAELIPDHLLPVYFLSDPEGYLVDPQRLLSMQESMDLKGFLDYHAADSALDIKMYLYDEHQKLPEPYTIERLCRERYADGPLTAVVFCFLANPERNRVAFGGSGAAEIPPQMVRRMLDSAKIKGLEKSDPATQLEAFIVQMSVRLYWLERDREQARALAKINEIDASKGASLYFDALSGDDTWGLQGGEPVTMIRAYAPYMIAGCLGLVSLCAGLWLGCSLWSRTRRYHFPVFDPPERLGAKYAAGVGAVLAFHSELGSPSSQRSQVPNYLTRM
jgi:hypothetical protein